MDSIRHDQARVLRRYLAMKSKGSWGEDTGARVSDTRPWQAVGSTVAT